MKNTHLISLLAISVALVGCGGSSSHHGTTVTRGPVIGLWTTTSVPNGSNYMQVDRLARPAVNELFATVANNRHQINDQDNPTDDAANLKNDIESFLTDVPGRSTATKTVIESVLIPDVLKADLSKTDSAAYLGTETGGATGGKFGGRKLKDDVIDISLGIVFGNTVSARAGSGRR